MSPISWLPVPGRRRRLAGRRCLEILTQGLGQDDSCGPDLDPGHGGQDLVKRVGLGVRVCGVVRYELQLSDIG